MAKTKLAGLGIVALLASAGCAGDEPSWHSTCSDEPGTTCNWAGVLGRRGTAPDGTFRTDSPLGFPSDLTFAPDGRAWIADWNNHMVRRVESDGTLTTMMGVVENGTVKEGDGALHEEDRLPFCDPEGADGLEVALNHPTDIEFGPDGTVYLAAWHNNKVRTMDPESGVVKVLTGDSYGYAGADSPACSALLNQPKALAIDDDGRVYTIDQRNQRIRMIDVDADRTITTVVGTGVAGYSGDGGPAIEATMAMDSGTTPIPTGSLALRDGFLYFADSLNHRIRRVDLESGVIECIAGNGERAYGGDGGPALEASFAAPVDIEFGPDGRLYVADTFNNAIRAIDLDTSIVETVAGNGEQCDALFNCYEPEDGVDAHDLQLLMPNGIAFDAVGALYIADSYNNRIVRVAQ